MTHVAAAKRRRAMAAMRKDGYTYGQIAERFGTLEMLVWKACKEAGLVFSLVDRRMRRQKMATKVWAGADRDDVADEFEVDRSTLNKACREFPDPQSSSPNTQPKAPSTPRSASSRVRSSDE